jgi:type IV pilus assembly protein PilY1
VGVAFPVAVPAAPGDLAQKPLFVSTSVKPNILFVLDDSNSMDSEVLKSAGATAAHPTTIYCKPPQGGWIANCENWEWELAFLYSDTELLATQPLTRDDQMLALCPGYNVLAYDPAVAYTPWVGKDKNGNPFRDRGLNDALDDPYQGTVVDLTVRNPFYFRWADNGDGAYAPGECPRACANSPVDGCNVGAATCAGINGCVLVSSLDAGQQKNYANWYSYYRKREYVLKRTVSQIVDGAKERVGLTSIHNTGETSTPISDMAVSANKASLLGKLHLMDAGAGGATPLRQALDDAGRYFHAGDGLGHRYLPCAAGSADACSPILPASEGGNCQQNFAVLVTDGFWLDSGAVWPAVGAAGFGDEDSAGSITSEWDGGSHADAVSDNRSCAYGSPIRANTLADIAMHYYEADLAPSLAGDLIPLPGIDENTQQHLVTFGVAFGVAGTLTSDPPNRTDPFPWPWVCEDEPTAVDDLRHAAWNGRGKFLSARNPAGTAAALSAAISDISQRAAATASSVAFNSTRLASDTLLFQSRVDPLDWSGDLLAFPVAADGTVAKTPVWRAAERLDGAMAPASRVILTRGETDGVTFEWANLTSAQKRDLCVSDQDCTNVQQVLGQLRLGFLRGDRACEDRAADAGCATGVDIDANGTNDNLILRKRGSRLGDIVGSGPLLVGAPALGWPSANTTFFPTASGQNYAGFKSANTARSKVVYVGANDGMLHGFRASDGMEVLAYVPSTLASSQPGSGLHYLTEPAFRSAHRFYVDRTPAISDVYIPSTDGGSDRAWRTVAVGGLGAGGRGIYALDITDPRDFSATNAAKIVMWEFTSTNDPELGYTVSQPIIAMMNNGKWAAIFGSGYNDTGDNEAHLFIVFLEEGLDGVWEAGEYVKIKATLGTDENPLAERNGLSSPAVADLDGNGTADRIYAGDLLGNLWAFNVKGTGTESWGIAGAGAPLFRAGTNQPITVKPEISKHPSKVDIADGSANDNQPNVMVYFGTGQLLTLGDNTTSATQAFYGVWDRGVFGRTKTDLREQTFESGYTKQVLTDNAVNWTSQYGWYFNLPDTGERVVVDATLRGGIVFFNSVVPAGVVTSPCEGGGTGYLYAVDIENGGPPDAPVFDTDQVGEAGYGVVDGTDVVPGGSGAKVPVRASFIGGIQTASTFMGNVQYTGSTEAGGLQTRAVAEIQGLDTGRLSWQQLYRE